MKTWKTWSLLAFLCLSAVLKAQDIGDVKEDYIPRHTDSETKIYEMVEQKAEFPGGSSVMSQWLSKVLKYPAEAVKKGIEGRVFVRFVVEKDGSIGDVKIVRSLDSLCNAEALRVVRLMPRWEPGRFDGVPVRSYYTIPIQFKLSPSGQLSGLQADGEKVYESAEQLAEFPGGLSAWEEWMRKSVRYPAEALEEKVEGRVFVRFVVRKDGSVTDAKIVRSLHPACDAEVLRVIGLMPRWKPGMTGGQAVHTLQTLPVLFEMPEPKAPRKPSESKKDAE